MQVVWDRLGTSESKLLLEISYVKVYMLVTETPYALPHHL